MLAPVGSQGYDESRLADCRASTPGSWTGIKVIPGEVTRQILVTYEAGDLITMCAWCRRVEIDGEWVLAPRAALTAIDTLSHSICPGCAAVTAEQHSVTA